MKLKLSYQRVKGATVDIVVIADPTATIADVAEEIAAADPQGRPAALSGRVLTLSVAPPGSSNFGSLGPERVVAESRVASGYQVRVIPATGDQGAPTPVSAGRVTLTIESGEQSGQSRTFAPGTYTIGRTPGNTVLLNDMLVSKTHARLEVGETVELVDLNSANGILVDGGLVSRLNIVDGQRVVLGDTEVRFNVVGVARPVTVATVVNASVPFNRSPRVEPRYPSTEFDPPEIPSEFEKPPFPWVMMVVPIIGGAAMALVMGPRALYLVAMSPLMMLGNFMMTRMRSRRQRDGAGARFEAQFAELQRRLSQEVPQERAAREGEAPSAAVVVQAAINGEALLWTRRPEHRLFLHIRLGTGRALSRNSVRDMGSLQRGLPAYVDRVTSLVEAHRYIDDVPIVEDPRSAGAIGVVGTGARVHDVVRGILCQWVGLHSPAELVVAAICASSESAEYEWLKWLPHVGSPSSPISDLHLADGAATARTLLAHLEELVDARMPDGGADLRMPPVGSARRAAPDGVGAGERDRNPPMPLPALVLLVTDQAPVDRARLVQLLERAQVAGIMPVFVAAVATELPATCRTFIDVGTGTAAVHYVRRGETLDGIRPEMVTRAEATAMATGLSARVDTGAFVSDASDLPAVVPLVQLLGPEIAAEDGSGVVDRWRQNDSLNGLSTAAPGRRVPTLRALIGQAGADALHLDLRAHGPHALVGGTTGSGKSEFLQSWVLGMAAEYSPDRVTFLFVDYKGGAAFAECVNLPHCVGLVTDLSPHLVRRALISLRAELRTREHILNAKKAKDLIELERRGDPEAPPALVIIIDEFAALVGEVPEFVDGVVDIAQRGRSLGIHLVMATQRPAGVIRDNLRANTNLRVALRMADESDSSDVVGVQDAAHFDPGVPGRALAKTGPGRLVPFQSAYAGGWSLETPPAPQSSVHELRFGAVRQWQRPEQPEVPERVSGPNDLTRLVAAISAGASAARVRAPRRPWLDELAPVYDLADLGAAVDTELVIGMADLPSEQSQHPVHFLPDRDGHLAVYGTGGSGKTVLLRTLAIGAAATTADAPVDVYALDFASGGLRMLGALPHVGAVIAGDDSERMVRLFKTLRHELEVRADTFANVDADTITDYRRARPGSALPRILLLVDGFQSFREEYEGVSGRASCYTDFLQVLSEGRQFGIHAVFTADRPASVPGAVTSRVPRRLVLRMADDTMYSVLDVPTDVLGPDSPAGRAILDGLEVQVAVLGGSGVGSAQARRVGSLAERLAHGGRAPAAGVAALPEVLDLAELPATVRALPVLGISDEDLEPIGFLPSGTFLVGGPPGSGRSNALDALVTSLERWDPDGRRYFLGGRRSSLARRPGWAETATATDDVIALAKRLVDELEYIDDGQRPVCVVVEAVADFLSTPADASLVELIKTAKRTGNLIIGESETSTWSSPWPLLGEFKSSRTGVLLQPDPLDGEVVLKTPFPRLTRSAFPVGRGCYARAGKVVRVQLPLVDGGVGTSG